MLLAEATTDRKQQLLVTVQYTVELLESMAGFLLVYRVACQPREGAKLQQQGASISCACETVINQRSSLQCNASVQLQLDAIRLLCIVMCPSKGAIKLARPVQQYGMLNTVHQITVRFLQMEGDRFPASLEYAIMLRYLQDIAAHTLRLTQLRGMPDLVSKAGNSRSARSVLRRSKPPL